MPFVQAFKVSILYELHFLFATKYLVLRNAWPNSVSKQPLDVPKENTVLGRRRIQYEDEVSQDVFNYDVWFDYSQLEEGVRDLKALRLGKRK